MDPHDPHQEGDTDEPMHDEPPADYGYPSNTDQEGPYAAQEEQDQPPAEPELQGDDAIIAQCLAKFAAPDALYSVELLTDMRAYLAASGAPADFVDAIRSGHRGYAEMANLVSGWLLMTGLTEAEVTKILVDALRNQVAAAFDPVAADRIFASENREPLWFKPMIASSTWRSLIYDLSLAHKNCLFLKFAIQRISAAGYQEEIAALPTIGEFHSIFTSILSASLCNLKRNSSSSSSSSKSPSSSPSSSDAATKDGSGSTVVMAVDSAEFHQLVCGSQNTYLFTQILLRGLADAASAAGGLSVASSNSSRHSEAVVSAAAVPSKWDADHALSMAAAWRRVSQDLSQAAQTLCPPLVAARMDCVAAGAFAWPHVATGLATMIGERATNPADVSRLHAAFSADPPESRPPVELLRSPTLLELLLDNVFTTTLHRDLAPKYIYVLAYAASVGSSADVSANHAELQGTIDAISAVAATTQQAGVGPDLLAAYSSFDTPLNYPVVALGLLRWIQAAFHSDELYTKGYAISGGTPAPVHLLRDIILRHPSAAPRASDVLWSCLNRAAGYGGGEGEAAVRDLLVSLVPLMKTGGVMDTMTRLQTWLKSVEDSSVVMSLTAAGRHAGLEAFLEELMNTIRPPYSAEFAGIVSGFLAVPSFHTAVKLGGNPSTLTLFKGFLGDISDPNPSQMNTRKLWGV